METTMSLAKTLEDLHRLINRQWAQDSARLGISHSEFEYLRAIKAHESDRTCQDENGQHLQDVVTAMGIRKASASAMVAKLEKRGLVARIPCRYDARAQHILLTEKGREALGLGEKIYEAAVKTLRSQTGEKGFSMLAAVLEVEGSSR